MNYITPEYYKHFKCKCGECRHSCCDGWPIRISKKEYYSLLGIRCSDTLRTKLDCALKINETPSNECFAQISTNWHGICKLHREDGLCALQVELGESYLPEVCRLYPRNTKRLIEINKCSCSNSCEEVLELLMNLKEPLKFEKNELSVDPEFETNLSPEKYECCQKSVSIIQERSLPLPERFINLGNFLYGTDIYSKKPDHLSLAFQSLYAFDKYFEKSISVRDYCKEALNYFGLSGKEKLCEKDTKVLKEKYILASLHLDTILPDWSILFEQLIVNHMFYNNFPYIDQHEQVHNAYLALVIMYTFLRFNMLGYMYNKTNKETLIDYLAAMFRLIEHSNFKYIAVRIFKEENYSIFDCTLQMLYV